MSELRQELLRKIKDSGPLIAVFEGVCHVSSGGNIEIRKAFFDHDFLRVGLFKDLASGVVYHSADESGRTRFEETAVSAACDRIAFYNDAEDTVNGLLMRFVITGVS